MNEKFFNQFKQYLLNSHMDDLKSFIPYYETLKQQQDKLKDFIDDCEQYALDIQYDEDKTEGYTDGSLQFYLYKDNNDWTSRLDYHYDLELGYDERYWNYCTCQSGDEGYIKALGCTGEGCDWIAPEIRLTKVSNVCFGSFNGHAKEMHYLEKEWDEYLKEDREKQRQAQLERVEQEIERLKSQRSILLKGGIINE
ncbi:hypothetical protein CIL05_07825 [Virgibacillus profundi]|uniref:Uncharacterized protein n=1 Tax=Virgibacillus profundi TaxID=2024555 RepID=A0A2A2IEC7_9BACI|nr:hypothetical protein [Virgibacillus profundi]PAV30371.1 hypothetical protein CIL05_07825 [Virgibacillus profundi]PXY54543.1 hypothetical protein CIT14_07910 [Virgibacillus profundi]